MSKIAIKGLVTIVVPPELQPAVNDYMVSMRLLRDCIGGKSWAEVLRVADREWAAKTLKGTKRQQEAHARCLVTHMALEHIVEMGGKPVYKTKKGKRNVKRTKK